MSKVYLPVQPGMLIWARNRRGYDVETAAKKLSLKPEQLRALESGEKSPTPAQIRNASDVYLISPAAFFLPEVPKTGFESPRDFRTVGSSSGPGISPELRKEIERVRAQREVMEAFARDGLIQAPAIDFAFRPDEDIEDTAARIREWLGIGRYLAQVKDRDNILRAWIDAIEARGVLVAQMSRIPISEARGFCIAQQPFPVIVLNGADKLSPRLFTLIHELVHVLHHEDGVCNDPSADGNTEAYCNAVAASAAIPRAELLAHPLVKHSRVEKLWSLDHLEEMAAPYGVSREAVLRRLLTLGLTTPGHYQQIRALLMSNYSDPVKKEKTGGPPTPVMILRNLGRTYVRSVLAARNLGYITDSRVGDYIFAKIQHAGPMAELLDVPYS